MKSVLLKRVPRKITKDAKEKEYSSWGSEAFCNKVPAKNINLIKSKRMV